MGKAYFVVVKNDSERQFFETCVDREIVSNFSPPADLAQIIYLFQSRQLLCYRSNSKSCT